MNHRNDKLGRPAALLQISAGTGPREVRLFVAALGEVLAQLCVARGRALGAWICDGPEHEPRSLALELDSRVQLGDLIGTHELVMPRVRAKRRRRRGGDRKRWFVGVSVHPCPVRARALPRLDPRELDIRCDRAGGPGGQHVNTCASAVRIVHRPTSLSVRVASERSQHANKKLALERLAAMLDTRARARREAAEAQRRLAHHQIERGGAVASWRFGGRRGDQLIRLGDE